MGRLSKQQLETAQKRAIAAHNKLIRKAKKKVAEEQGQGAFFAVLFQMAAAGIEGDVDTFCDRAEQAFEEIEAHGHEPLLSEDWLAEITGEKDNFYFSTDNLVSDLASPPRKKRRKKQLSQEEIERIKHEIENAIIEEDDSPCDFHQALAVAHGENVEHWIETIRRTLEDSNSETLEFWRLRDRTGLEPTELFLGLLLGQENWIVRQQEFYGTVSVEPRRKQ